MLRGPQNAPWIERYLANTSFTTLDLLDANENIGVREVRLRNCLPESHFIIFIVAK